MNAFTIDILVRASALLSAAALADVVLRRRASAATRHLVWTLAVAALLALPFASLALPAWHVPIAVARPAAALTVDTGAAPLNASIAREAALRAAPVPCLAADAGACAGGAAPAAAVTAWHAIARLFPALISVAYGLGVLVLLARLALEPLALRRLTRAACEITGPAWRRTLGEAAAAMGIGRPVRLLRAGAGVMPLTFGTRAPAIVLPASADGWTEDRRRAVLLHELAHVARADCLIQRLTALACALYWPHPGVWWAARRLRAERELACDDRVIAAGAPARDYAGHLLEIAHAFRAAPAPATALGMARASQLERRLLAILDDARNRAALGRGRRSLFVAAAILAFVPMAVLRAVIVPTDDAAPASSRTEQARELTGTWELHPSSDPGRVQLTIRRGRSTHGRTLAVADLERLAGTRLSAAATVRFPIRREAGTFSVDGTCRDGVCAGTFAFEPNSAFTEEMVRRGIGRPTPQDQFTLAAADIGTAYLDALTAAGYAKPDLALLVRAAQHGVDLSYVRDMAALGYRLGTLDPLIRLRDHGVDPAYVRGMADSGYTKLPADELVRTRDHGVDPAFVRGLASLGHTGLPVDALVTARDHGVDPEYIRGMQGLGHRLTLDEFRRTRDHGVDPEYVRGLSALGYGSLTVDDLVTARDHGVDPAYVRDMAALGYKGVTLEQLIRMRDHGVDPAYVRRLQQEGVSNLSVDQIVRRRDRGGD